MRIRLRHEQLQELIASRSLSQNHWAMKIGLSRGHWSDIVNGKHPFPSVKTRQRLLEAFAVPLEELFVVESGPGGGLPAPAKLPERYVVDSELGQGGMGTVYLARDVQLGRTVAIKIVSSEAVGGIGAEQLLKEIRYTARLHHPHILPLHDAGTLGSSPFYVMPYVSDGSLADCIEQRGRLPLDEVMEITRGVAAALSFAHDSQVLHCDIKPGNILLAGRHAYVSDFGLARAIHLEAFEWGRPQEIDSSAGTPAYVSPEQAGGETRLDPRSDVYSLACVVYEMLTGKPAFSGRTTLETVAQRFTAEPPDPRSLCPDIPAAVAQVVRQGMCLEGERRYQSINELWDALQRAADSGQSGSARLADRLAATAIATAIATAAAGVSGTARRLLCGITPSTSESGSNGLGRKVQRMLFSLRQDMVYALQAFRRAPVFTAVVVLTLAFGIAANTHVFSLINPYFVRPLPFAEPSQLVQIGQVDAASGFDMVRFSLPQLQDYRERSSSFESLAGYYYSGLNLTGEGSPERVEAGYVTASMLSLLGAPAAHGRIFLPEEGRVDDGDGVILDHGLWQRRFGGDPEVLGRSISVHGERYTVVGVMPPDFVFPFGGIDLWLLIEEGPAASRGLRSMLMVGRLKPGRTTEGARRELNNIHSELARLHPDIDGKYTSICVKPLRRALNFAWDILLSSFSLMLVTVACALLIVCVNVSILMLARGTTRSGEMALRAALGASRRRLLRQLMTESALLAMAGAAVGIVLAGLLSRLVAPLIPEDLYRVGEASIDGTVLLFSLGLTVATLLLFGLAPALASTRSNLGAALRERDGGATMKTSMRARRGLVVLEIAVAVLLISGLGLAARSLALARDVELGFDVKGVVTFRMAPSETSYPDSAEVAAYYENVVRTVEALPGVSGAATVRHVPQNHETSHGRYSDPETATADPEEWPVAILNRISTGYLETMGISLLEGRNLDPADVAQGTARVALVSRSLAAELWPEQSAVGRMIQLNRRDEGSGLRIVGIAGDVRHEGIAGAEYPQVYLPMAAGARSRYLVVAAEGSPGVVVREVRNALLTVDSQVPATPRSMQDIVDQNFMPWSMTTVALAINGGSALLLAIFGIYGVVAYSVAQQRSNIGVRMALGATPQRVRGAFIWEGLKLSGVGIAVGLCLAMVANHLLAAALYGIDGFDSVTFVTVAVVFVAVTVLASVVPAIRASRVEPMQVLRYE